MIDLILTNHRSSFWETTLLETLISGQHKMIFSILKHNSAKGQPKSICYRDLNFDPNSFEKFLQIFQDTAQLFAPLKKKIIRLTIKSLSTKAFKNIMIRSKLQNKYSKNMR